MICCSKCFCDMEIQPIIESLNNKGDCPTCGSQDTYLYDTDKNDSITSLFEDLINIYTPVNLLPSSYPRNALVMLKDELNSNWKIFNGLRAAQIYEIVKGICKETYSVSSALFDSPVGIAESFDRNYLSTNSILKTNKWEDFVYAIKHENRFHTDYINTDILKTFCSYIRKPYKKGSIFFRGRIAPKKGYSKNEMGPPPQELSIESRANSHGISRLYLANNIETTIHEVRAGAFDYVTIGTFELQEDIIIVDLKLINAISPFIEPLNCLQYAVNKEHLQKINSEMAKPLRRSDSPLDYVPTQYISDLIKSITHRGQYEYAGIEYNSTMRNEGSNLAIFYPDLFKCISTQTFRIDSLEYKKTIIMQ